MHKHSKTKRRVKSYTKAVKRSSRLKRRSRRLRSRRLLSRRLLSRRLLSRRLLSRHMRSRHMRSRRLLSRRLLSRRLRGGGDTTLTIPPYQPSGASPDNNIAQQGAATRSHNSGNIALAGGGRRRKIKKQQGGDVSTAIMNLYKYIAPTGMMGPVPQPSTDDSSNKLILQAAKISTTGQANAQYDNNVNNVVK